MNPVFLSSIVIPDFLAIWGKRVFITKAKVKIPFFVSFGEVYLMAGVTKSLYYFNIIIQDYFVM